MPGGGGASGDGGLPVQGGGQAQYPQCRHQATRQQQQTKNPLKKLTVHCYYLQFNPIFSFPFPRRALPFPVLFLLLILSCPLVS